MKNILASEKVAAYSHAGTIPVFIIGLMALLVTGAGNSALQLVALVYGFSAILLFSCSFLYHANKKRENDKSLWRKLDHTAIFFLIAGTYTPICYIYLDGTMKWSILGAQWGLVFAGTVFKLFFINAPRYIGTLIYLIMGWIVLIPFPTLVDTMAGPALTMLIVGGVMYTVGAIIYGFKWPNPWPDIFGFHEIFHVFVSAGAVPHLGMVFWGVRYAVMQ
ncbi:MAG: hemolysin III [Desulforhopalus sp.]|jgi:hemolysin III